MKLILIALISIILSGCIFRDIASGAADGVQNNQEQIAGRALTGDLIGAGIIALLSLVGGGVAGYKKAQRKNPRVL